VVTIPVAYLDLRIRRDRNAQVVTRMGEPLHDVIQ
jgi:hypothetical protein